MSESTVNNKRIAKNTLYLYLRMLLVMAIGLYTVRAILDILGVVNYGIYNVVGGVVTMFAFMNRTLSTSSQRYFSVALAKNDQKDLKRVFSLNLTIFLILGLIIFLLLETVGLWFVNNKMTIPDERMVAANVVYQLSIIAMFLHIVVIPYMALVVAHEKMNVFAIIGVVEAVGKLAIVFLLTIIYFDKLIIYGILVLLLSFATTLWYVIYCLKHYPESHYRWYWNKSEAIELMGFSGWHFMGTFSTTCRSQGINILLNVFFNPAVNAARAIAFQVNTHIMQLSSNFLTAIKPQIYKSYAKGELDELYKLIMRGTIISTFLISLIAFPVLSCTSYILGLWLKEVPDYAVAFTKLALINGLIDSIMGVQIAPVLATGRIKRFYLIESSIMFSNVPISYFSLLLGCEPTITMIVSIMISCIATIVRAYLLKLMIGFPWGSFLSLISKIALASFMMFLCVDMLGRELHYNLLSAVIIMFVIMTIVVIVYGMIISRKDRQDIIKTVKHKLYSRKCQES